MPRTKKSSNAADADNEAPSQGEQGDEMTTLSLGRTASEPDEPAEPSESAEAVPSSSPEPDGRSSAPAPGVQQIIVRQGSGWQTTALVFLALLLLTTIGVAFYAFHRVGELNAYLSTTMHRVEEKIQNLDAGISFDSKRQQLLLGIRDEIMRTNPRVSLSEAYEYAALIMENSERYPSVDPLMFLAIGIVESRFDHRATSEANAKGLYQIWPSTGRLLARSLDWEYSDDMLYDPAANTEMAALYLDILFSAYNDRALVLAEYNGGPLNAGYYRAGSGRAAAETRNYVEQVGAVHESLKNKFELGVELTMMEMHRDRSRNGKLLGVPSETRLRDRPPAARNEASMRNGSVEMAGQ